jgi:hypothetical protein
MTAAHGEPAGGKAAPLPPVQLAEQAGGAYLARRSSGLFYCVLLFMMSAGLSSLVGLCGERAAPSC